MSDDLNVLAFPADKGGCGHMRLIEPFRIIKEQGLANVEIGPRDFGTYEKMIEKLRGYMHKYDVFIHQRVVDPGTLELINAEKDLGKCVISEQDDNLFYVDPQSPMYVGLGTDSHPKWAESDRFNHIQNRDNIRRFVEAIQKSDGVTTTCPQLEKRFGWYNDNVYILENCLDMRIWTYGLEHFDLKRKDTDKVRIFWAGGWTHYNDIATIVEPIRNVLKRDKNSEFWMYGWGYEKFWEGLEDQIQYGDFIDFEAHPWRMQLLPIDIGVCPLVPSEFTICKSFLKYLEYSLIGIPTVASNCEPYSNIIEHGVDGYLIDWNDRAGWERCLNRLIGDKDLRNEIAGKAYEKVLNNYNLVDRAKEWVEAYENILRVA